ncbi:SHOCT domain-containing protein [Streptomyces radiopugnans]|uniref:Putative membrane protein n=1 Tax=Streptomyces radiopugnans TaxID=403935 RepID=A0A1H9KQR2_9ACTN|nr:SHOCT domain-containing protein [Streptomyces radiopugnans]SER01490.1 putative membrane protein [Streptomyces radiopugnans]
MMFWNGHGVSGWEWFAMSAGMILFWVLVITAAALLFRALDRPRERPRTSEGASAERLLAERFARGEIDEEEYRGRLAVLHSSGPSANP